jgi:NAD(P)-dependent dehydrogenase (short-subunit alcohol dehydrogenase family)
MFDLSGMTALVTGASGGIGSAIAKALAEQGARVALSGTRQEVLRKVADEIGGDHVVISTNLSDSEAVDRLVPQAIEQLGQLDILINNAGVTRDNLAMRMKDEEWSDVIRINLEAAFRLSRAALKPMMRARFGRIVSITSVVGATGNPGTGQLRRLQSGARWYVQGARPGSGEPRHHRELHCAGFHRIGHDGCPARCAERKSAHANPGGQAGRRRRYCSCGSLPCQPGGCLCDRPYLACERRYGDVVSSWRRPAAAPHLPAPKSSG